MLTRRAALASFALLLLGPGAWARADVGAGSPLVEAEEVKRSISRAAEFFHGLSTEGAYVWIYSEDLRHRAGEALTTPTQAWVQPPGTPSVGETYLRAYAVTGEEKYFEYARAAAHGLARGQLQSGGWDYMIEFDPAERERWAYRVDAAKTSAAAKKQNTTTFDDNTTQSALRYLLAFSDVAKSKGAPDALVEDALAFGLKRMVEAQYPVGAWPQRWKGEAHNPETFPVKAATIAPDYPREQPKTSYYGHYTLNDNAHRDAILVMLDAHRRTGKAEYLDAVRRAVQFLILAQLPEPQPVWAQQYNSQMQPAWARAFEPPAVCSAESANVVALLIDLYLEVGDESFLKPVPSALAWFKKSAIGVDRWARLYELGTNRPIYGDRDGKIHYSLEEISAERQNGYAWEGEFEIPKVIAYAEAVLTQGREAWLAKHPHKRLFATPKPAKAAKLGPRVRQALDELDSQGRWLTPYRGRRFEGYTGRVIESRVFIQNMQLLCDYLASKSE
jgi:hypothetical protein